jgi:hypothetical protein
MSQPFFEHAEVRAKGFDLSSQISRLVRNAYGLMRDIDHPARNRLADRQPLFA